MEGLHFLLLLADAEGLLEFPCIPIAPPLGLALIVDPGLPVEMFAGRPGVPLMVVGPFLSGY